MRLKAKYRRGRLTFPRPIRFRHDEVAMQVVVDDDEIMPNEEKSEIEAVLTELAEEIPLLRDLWEGVGGTIPSVEDNLIDKRAHAFEAARSLQ